MPQRGAELQRRDHAERDRLAVQQAVARRRLQRVPDGVAEVQDRAPARFRLVRRDHVGLHPNRARDDLDAAASTDSVRARAFEQVEQAGDRR